MIIEHLTLIRGRTLYEDFSLSVARGEIFRLSGESGRGKTSLLYAIAGWIPIAQGTIDTEGRTAMVFQNAKKSLNPNLFVREILAEGVRLPEDVQSQYIRRLFEDTSIVGKKAGVLSGGEAQRIGFLRALFTAPDLLLLDEPFSALDPETRSSMAALLRDHILRYPAAVLLASHIEVSP